MRKKKHCDERIAACGDLLIDAPEGFAGRWRGEFSRRMEKDCAALPLALEIGCGKGAFILEMARREPDTLFVGVEMCKQALLLAMEKIKDAGFRNVVFLCRNAAELKEFFAFEEIDRIYLNFSDPWPKGRHAKRRLTAPSFLETYAHVLKKEGFLRQKTDNELLFASSIEGIMTTLIIASS